LKAKEIVAKNSIIEEQIEEIEEQVEEIEEINEELKQKYGNSALDADEIVSYKKSIDNIMRKEQLFLQPNLTLKHFAERLDISVNYLSQAINSAFNQNFYSFVNSYRIEYAMLLLKKPENEKKTVLAIAYDSGFKSKSTFNTLFKKTTGKTPTEYKRSL